MGKKKPTRSTAGKGWVFITSTSILTEGKEGRRIIMLPRDHAAHAADIKRDYVFDGSVGRALQKAVELGHVEFEYRKAPWAKFYKLLERTIGIEVTDADLPEGRELERYRPGVFDADQAAELCKLFGIKIVYPLPNDRLSVNPQWEPFGKNATGKKSRRATVADEADEPEEDESEADELEVDESEDDFD